jgi:hypothetical protein
MCPRMGQLILKRAATSRPSGEWSDDDFDVLADGAVVGRIFKVNAAPVGSPWMWRLALGYHEDRTPTHGYAASLLVETSARANEHWPGSTMHWQAWRKGLELYLDAPDLIVASILIAIAIFGFAWRLHSHISKERIATLQDRLRLGKQVQEHITNELDSLKLTASRQEAILNELRSTGVPRSQVELLSSANAAVIRSLADLEQANTTLGFALSLTGAGEWA